MQSIGERLEEARKRLGISIKDASHATKVRQHFLLSFENSNFDIGLPEIYCRGFLKLYCSFLKIDPERILADYQAIQLGTKDSSPTDNREFFGHITLDESSSEDITNSSKYDEPANTDATESETKLPVNIKKIGFIAGGAFAGIIALAFLINAIFSSTPQNIDEATGTETLTANIENLEEEQIFLVATDTVSVVVRQEIDKKRLYSGTLTKGERLPLMKKGQIKIHFNEGDNLLLEKDGQRYSMNAQGTNTRAFD